MHEIDDPENEVLSSTRDSPVLAKSDLHLVHSDRDRVTADSVDPVVVQISKTDR